MAEKEIIIDSIADNEAVQDYVSKSEEVLDNVAENEAVWDNGAFFLHMKEALELFFIFSCTCRKSKKYSCTSLKIFQRATKTTTV